MNTDDIFVSWSLAKGKDGTPLKRVPEPGEVYISGDITARCIDRCLFTLDSGVGNFAFTKCWKCSTWFAALNRHDRIHESQSFKGISCITNFSGE